MPRPGNVSHIVVCFDIRPICNGICAACSVRRLVVDTVGCRLDLHIARDRIDRTAVIDTIICCSGDRNIPCDRANAGRITVGRDLIDYIPADFIRVLILVLYRPRAGHLNSVISCGADRCISADRIDHTAAFNIQGPILRTDRDTAIDRGDLASAVDAPSLFRTDLHTICYQSNGRIRCIALIHARVLFIIIIRGIRALGNGTVLIKAIFIVHDIPVSGRGRTTHFCRAADLLDRACVAQSVIPFGFHNSILDRADRAGIGVRPLCAVRRCSLSDISVPNAIGAGDRCPVNGRDRTTGVEQRIVVATADSCRTNGSDFSSIDIIETVVTLTADGRFPDHSDRFPAVVGKTRTGRNAAEAGVSVGNFRRTTGGKIKNAYIREF